MNQNEQERPRADCLRRECFRSPKLHKAACLQVHWHAVHSHRKLQTAAQATFAPETSLTARPRFGLQIATNYRQILFFYMVAWSRFVHKLFRINVTDLVFDIKI